MRRFPISGGVEKLLLVYLSPNGIDLIRVVHASRNPMIFSPSLRVLSYGSITE